MTRFWLGRSVAGRLLGLATTKKARKEIVRLSERLPWLAENVHKGKQESFSKTKRQAEQLALTGPNGYHNDFISMETLHSRKFATILGSVRPFTAQPTARFAGIRSNRSRIFRN
jgi:hypothetical protein